MTKYNSTIIVMILLSFLCPIKSMAQMFDTQDLNLDGSYNTENVYSDYLNDVGINAAITQSKPNISIGVSPSNPSPGEKITLSLTSYSIDLNTTNISWFVNDKMIKSGIGEKETKTTVGTIGEKLNITAKVKYLGSEYSYTRTIIPSEITIISEAETITPPFYKGLSLPNSKSKNKIIAVTDFVDTNGNKINKNEIVFTWKIDGQTQPKYSGIGKNSFIYEHYSSKSYQVSVLAQKVGGGLSGKSTKKISSVYPTVLLYGIRPNLGILFNRTLSGKWSLVSNSLEISAFPLFFNKKDDPKQYLWFIDGVQTIFDPEIKTLVLNRETDVNGSNSIFAKIKTPTMAAKSSYVFLEYGNNFNF